MRSTFWRLSCLFGAITSFVCLLPRCNAIVQAPDGPLVVDAGDGALPEASPGCALSTDSGACGACLDTHCCGEEQRCAESPACAEYERCLVPCGQDYACRSRCLIGDAVRDSSEAAQLDQCLMNHCESACGVTCVPWTISEPDVADDCAKCIQGAACPAGEACAKSKACDEGLYCVESCVTRDCQGACASAPDAGAPLGAFLSEVRNWCAQRCGVGQYWGCVDKVTWPVPKSASMQVKVHVADPLTSQPMPNVDVTACIGRNCSSPVSGTTDDSGVVTLVLTASPIVPDSSRYFALTQHPSAQADAAADDPASVMPYLTFLNGPLSEPMAELFFVPFTRAEFAAAAASAGVTLDPAKGHVALIAEDCFLLATSGAVITSTTVAPGMIETYASKSAANLTPATVQSATDATGLAVFFNAPSPTTLTFDVTPRSLGRVSSTVSLFVRPGFVSAIEASPGQQ
jgi:hypothetical protein